MKKIIIVTAIVVVVLVVGVFLFFGQKQSTSPGSGGTGGTNPTATSPISNPPAGDTVMMPTSQGNVQINNFYKNPEQVTPDKTSLLINGTNGYDIMYYAPDESFTISISATPVPATIAQAEAAFLQKLGVSKADACKLKVRVSVPISVDPNYSGQNLGLSFCSGGLQ